MNKIIKLVGTKVSRISSDAISDLKKDEIFVFGSNIQGKHIGGAAKIAEEKFGAIEGKHKGQFGNTYAIPTVDLQKGRLKLNKVRKYVNEFIEFAEQNPNKDYLVTEIGCGIAGFTTYEIAPLFKEAIDVKNIYLPSRFISLMRKGI